MIKDNIKVTGTLQIVVTNQDGKIKEELTIPNLVVTTGRQYIAARMKETGRPAEMSHMAIGSSATGALAANTTLGTQLGSRVALGTSGGTVSSNAVTYSATFAAGVGTGAVAEAGIFNAATIGTMLARTTFPVVNKAAGDSVSITWTVTIN